MNESNRSPAHVLLGLFFIIVLTFVSAVFLGLYIAIVLHFVYQFRF